MTQAVLNYNNGITLDLTATFAAYEAPRTPFGVYDNDAQFIADADGFVRMISRRLANDILQVEITNYDAYSCLEQAMLEYSAIANTYQAKSVLLNLIGSPTGTFSGVFGGFQNQVPRYDLDFAKRTSNGYSTEAGVGGTRPLYSASIDLVPGMQKYDLNQALSGTIPAGSRAEIREIFHFDPASAYRFFDTTSAINYLHNQFNFESFTPETIFYMLPIWEDVLRAQQLELNQRVRRSNYSFNVINNELAIYPVPTNSVPRKMYFTYYLVGVQSGSASAFDPNNPFTTGVANLSNVPFGNLQYSQINSIGKQWVKKMALAFAKETIGYSRRKANDIPIPNGNLTLDGAAMVQEGLTEQQNLREELKEWLDSLTYSRLLQQQTDEAEALQRILMKIPNAIFTG